MISFDYTSLFLIKKISSDRFQFFIEEKSTTNLLVRSNSSVRIARRSHKMNRSIYLMKRQ